MEDNKPRILTTDEFNELCEKVYNELIDNEIKKAKELSKIELDEHIKHNLIIDQHLKNFDDILIKINIDQNVDQKID